MLFRILRITLLLALIAVLVVPCAAGVRLGTVTVGYSYFHGWGPYCC